MRRKLIILSDCTDVAINEIRLSIYQELREEIQIEPAIKVVPFSLINGSFLLRLVAEIAEPKTIFYVVVNPLTTQPARIMGKTKEKDFIFVGRDSGIFGWFIEHFGCSELYHINDTSFVPFGGKKIYPNIISQLINGVPFNTLGYQVDCDSLNKIEINEGVVLHIDNFGLVKMMHDKRILNLLKIEHGDIVNIFINEKIKINAIYTNRMMSENDGAFTLYIGSSLNGLLELGSVRGNICNKIDIQIGDIVRIEKHDIS